MSSVPQSPDPHALPHPGEGRVSRAIRDQPFTRVDAEVAALASRQEGVVDTEELRGLGLSAHAVSRRVRRGWLHPVHHCVYAVGHPGLSLHGRFVAAVKACGREASLSHRSAATRERFWEWRERPIEVTVPKERFCRFDGIQVHRSSFITRDDSFLRDGVLVTKPTWTLVALAAVVSEEELRRGVRHALAERITSLPALVEVLIRIGRARGTRVLKKILAQGAVPTRSVLEDVVYDLIVTGGFVPPEVNQPMRIEGRTVYPDFRWPEQRLIVEADGSKWHDDPLAQAADAERQTLLERHGETVLRVRWEEAMVRPEAARRRFAEAGAPRL